MALAHFGVTLASLWGDIGVMLGPVWAYDGDLGSPWATLGSLWGHFGVTLGAYGATFGI